MYMPPDGVLNLVAPVVNLVRIVILKMLSCILKGVPVLNLNEYRCSISSPVHVPYIVYLPTAAAGTAVLSALVLLFYMYRMY